MISKLDINNAIKVLKEHYDENKKYVQDNKHILNEEVIELILIEGESCDRIAQLLEKGVELFETITPRINKEEK